MILLILETGLSKMALGSLEFSGPKTLEMVPGLFQ